MPLEDFSGGDIWDAAWGESGFEDAKGLAAWARPQEDQTQERAELQEGGGGKPVKEGILQLPEEQALKEREQVRSGLHVDASHTVEVPCAE